MRALQYALIGVGGFGREHYETLRRLEARGLVELRAVCDPGLGHQPELESELRARGARIYGSYRKMLSEEPGLDAVTIAAPIPWHEEMALDCLGCGLFIYLEKPPVPLIGQLEMLLAADREEKVAVGFQMIDAEWSRRIKRWICEGKFGDIREIRISANWPRNGSYYRRAPWAGRMMLEGRPVFDGPATNALAHLVHNAMYFCAEGCAVFTKPVAVTGELYRVRTIESYDLACFRGILESGTRFSAALSHALREEIPFSLEIEGTRGWCRVSEAGTTVESSEGGFRFAGNGPGMLNATYEKFAGWAAGAIERPSTMLRDAEGYVLATNALLLSSGGIHDIGPAHYTNSDPDGDGPYEIAGLGAAMARDPAELFSEAGFPWGVRTAEIDVRDAGLLRERIDGMFGAGGGEPGAASGREGALA